ncbi:MAG: hypothetical protein ACJA1P_000501, partial [Maribacter sp.]
MIHTYRFWPLIVVVLFVGCKEEKKNKPNEQETRVEKPLTFITPLGKEFTIFEPSKKIIGQYEEAKKNFDVNPDDIEAIIWHGRRTAYLGRYDDAISIYAEGITKFPE